MFFQDLTQKVLVHLMSMYMLKKLSSMTSSNTYEQASHLLNNYNNTHV